MLIGGNYTLCSLDSILEYCFKQIQEQHATIVSVSNIPDNTKYSICQCLSSSLQESDSFYHRTENGCYGYHMTITPDYNEIIEDNEAINIAKERLERIGSISRPWLLLKELTTVSHYHLITTIVYPEDFNYEGLSFEEQTKKFVHKGQICPQKACGNLLQSRLKHGYISNFSRLFDIALNFDFDNFTQFSSILRLQGIGVVLDTENKKLFIHPLYHPKRPFNHYGGERLFLRMNLRMRTKKRKNFEENLLRIERIVSEAFHLGLDFKSYLREFGIIADLHDHESPIYIDTKKRRVYEHRDFKEFFTLEKYRKMINHDQWWRSVYNPLDKSYGSLFPIFWIGTIGKKEKKNLPKWRSRSFGNKNNS